MMDKIRINPFFFKEFNKSIQNFWQDNSYLKYSEIEILYSDNKIQVCFERLSTFADIIEEN